MRLVLEDLEEACISADDDAEESVSFVLFEDCLFSLVEAFDADEVFEGEAGFGVLRVRREVVQLSPQVGDAFFGVVDGEVSDEAV